MPALFITLGIIHRGPVSPANPHLQRNGKLNTRLKTFFLNICQRNNGDKTSGDTSAALKGSKDKNLKRY